MKKLICLLLLAVLLLTGCGPKNKAPVATSNHPQPTSTEAGSMLPDFTAFDTSANPVKLSDYHGKPIVLNFWASWCGPCKAEMPAFQALYEELGDQVQFLMVNVGENTDDAEAFIASAGYTFPVLFDVNREAEYAYQISAIPASFFINANGELVDSHVGIMSESDLRTAIENIQK